MRCTRGKGAAVTKSNPRLQSPADTKNDINCTRCTTRTIYDSSTEHAILASPQALLAEPRDQKLGGEKATGDITKGSHTTTLYGPGINSRPAHLVPEVVVNRGVDDVSWRAPREGFHRERVERPEQLEVAPVHEGVDLHGAPANTRGGVERFPRSLPARVKPFCANKLS